MPYKPAKNKMIEERTNPVSLIEVMRKGYCRFFSHFVNYDGVIVWSLRTRCYNYDI